MAPWGAALPTVGQPGRRPGARRRPPDPLEDLLATLRGHEVTLLVGSRPLTGKLVSAHPVILVDRTGRATVVRPAAIRAVTF